MGSKCFHLRVLLLTLEKGSKIFFIIMTSLVGVLITWIVQFLFYIWFGNFSLPPHCSKKKKKNTGTWTSLHRYWDMNQSSQQLHIKIMVHEPVFPKAVYDKLVREPVFITAAYKILGHETAIKTVVYEILGHEQVFITAVYGILGHEPVFKSFHYWSVPQASQTNYNLRSFTNFPSVSIQICNSSDSLSIFSINSEGKLAETDSLKCFELERKWNYTEHWNNTGKLSKILSLRELKHFHGRKLCQICFSPFWKWVYPKRKESASLMEQILSF